jgi:hypothetical protein
MLSFWFKWLIANVVGAAISSYFIGTISPLLQKVVLRSVAGTPISEIFIFLYRAWTGGILGALVVGSTIGAAQWFVLRTEIPLEKRFILITSLGWIFVGFFVNFYYIGAIGGASVGFSQWLVLRKKFFQSGWWIFANILGFGLAGFFRSIALSQISPYNASFEVVVNPGILIVLGSAFISSTVTGLALVWLLSYKKKSSS